VKDFISKNDVSNSYKEAFVNAYVHYVKYHGLKWKKPIYLRAERLPNVPTTEQVHTIIANSGREARSIFKEIREIIKS